MTKPKPCADCGKVRDLDTCPACNRRVCLDCHFDEGHSKEKCVDRLPKHSPLRQDRGKAKKTLLLLAVVVLGALAGRHRPPPAPPVGTLYLTPDAELLVQREVFLEYQLGTGFWVRVDGLAALVEGDCVRVYRDVGLRMRQCYAEWPESCSDPATLALTIPPCGNTQSFL